MPAAGPATFLAEKLHHQVTDLVTRIRRAAREEESRGSAFLILLFPLSLFPLSSLTFSRCFLLFPLTLSLTHTRTHANTFLALLPVAFAPAARVCTDEYLCVFARENGYSFMRECIHTYSFMRECPDSVPSQFSSRSLCFCALFMNIITFVKMFHESFQSRCAPFSCCPACT